MARAGSTAGSTNGTRAQRGFSTARDRLRWDQPRTGTGDAPSGAVLARTFAYLFGFGGLLALATLLLPHGARSDDVGIAVPAALAVVVAVAAVALFDRIPYAVFRLLPPFGTVLVTAVMLAAENGSAIAYGGFFFWVVLSAFYLFEWRWAWLNVAFVGVALAFALELSPEIDNGVLVWVMTVGSLAVGGGLVGLLRRRLELVALETQRALESAVRSERALAEAQEIAQIGSWEANIATREFSGSAELYRILDIEASAMDTIEKVFAALDPTARESIRDAIRGALAETRQIDLEHVVDLPTRGRRLLHTRARLVRSAGGDRTIVGATRDVTAQRAQADQLQRTLRRLRATLDVAMALGRDPDPDAVVDLITARARDLLGAESVVIELDVTEEGSIRAAEEDGDALVAPLTYRGVTHGLLVAHPVDHRAGFSTGDAEMFSAFASSVAVALASAKLLQDDALQRSIDAAERERRRFARELHDQTLQGLAGAAFLLESAASGGGPDALRQVAESVRGRLLGEIANLRRIIADLRPMELDAFGLRAALEALVKSVEREHGLSVDAQIELPPNVTEALDRTAEQTLYRVVQEALTNVRRHARATSVSVVVKAADGGVRVRVQDDGCGFDPASVQGFGLSGMRERLRLLDASLTVSSGSGGTTLETHVPIGAPATTHLGASSAQESAPRASQDAPRPAGAGPSPR